MKRLMICLWLLAVHGAAIAQGGNIPTRKRAEFASVRLPILKVENGSLRFFSPSLNQDSLKTVLESLYTSDRQIGLEEKTELSAFLNVLILAQAKRKAVLDTFKVQMDSVAAETDTKMKLAMATIRKEKQKGISESNALDDFALELYYRAALHRRAYSPLLDRKFQRIRNKLADTNDTERPAWGRSKSRLTELYYTNSLDKSAFQALNSSAISIGPQGGYSAYSELITDYLLVGKMSLSSQISNLPEDNDSTTAAIAQDNALENLIAGGGNVSLAYTIPVLDLHGGENFYFGTSATLPRIGVNLPGIKNVDTSPSMVVEFGFESYLLLTGIQRNFGIFGTYRYGYITGSRNFKKTIDRGEINLHQFSVGLTIKETYRIAANFYTGNQFVKDNFPAQMLSLTIIPDF